MSALSAWEHRALVSLSKLRSALANELAVVARLREARERGHDVAPLVRESSVAMRATTAAFDEWTREVRP